MNDDLLGRVLDGKYELVRLIGRGGMGVVYEARHIRLGRRVAVKILLDDGEHHQEWVQRFVREAQAASAIGHPNIVDVQDVGETDDGLHYIVMELLQGTPLNKHLEAAGRIGVGIALAYTAQVLAGLREAHARGIIHRDLKPANLHVLDDPYVRNRLKILDFGISKIVASDQENVDLTQSGAVVGTPGYMSPEQARGERDLDGRADLWSVGILLYQMLSGERPYEGRSYNEILTKIVLDPVKPITDKVPDLPAEVAAIVGKALTKDRKLRYPDANAFLAELAPLAVRYPELAALDWLQPGGETLTSGGPPPAPAAPEAPLPVMPEPRPKTAVSMGTGGTTRFDRPPPNWKSWLWYVLALPLALSPLAAPPDIVGPGTVSVLGLPESTPVWVAYLLTALLSGGLVAAATAVYRFWRTGRPSHLLHGPLFLVFPVAGLLAALRLHEQLRGQTTTFLESLRLYPVVDAVHAARMSELLRGVMRRYLNTVSFVMIVLSLLSLIVLLGFVFLPAGRPEKPRTQARWWTWLLLPGGLVAVGITYLAMPVPFHWLGPIWPSVILALWLTTATVLLRQTRGLAQHLEHGWGVIRAGALAMIAMSTVAGLVGLAAVFAATEQVEPVARAERVLATGDYLLNSILTLWGISLVLLLATVAVCRRGMGWFLAMSFKQRIRSVASTLAAVAAMTLPFYTIMSSSDAVMEAYEVPFARPALVEMVPVSLIPGQTPSFYVDKEPASLSRAPRAFYGLLTNDADPREPEPDDLLDLMAGNQTCRDTLLEALTPDESEATVRHRPARCVTGIEANLYCQSRGKRLPTPEEWEAVFRENERASAHRSGLAEWTMKLVHGTTIFHVAGRHAELGLPPGVSPEVASPKIGFRCAFTFEELVQ